MIFAFLRVPPPLNSLSAFLLLKSMCLYLSWIILLVSLHFAKGFRQPVILFLTMCIIALIVALLHYPYTCILIIWSRNYDDHTLLFPGSLGCSLDDEVLRIHEITLHEITRYILSCSLHRVPKLQEALWLNHIIYPSQESSEYYQSGRGSDTGHSVVHLASSY